MTICAEPTTTSVLFDGNIPTLTELDGNMWASQLLTLHRETERVSLQFDFAGTPGYSGVDAVKVVMFNCPEWGIAIRRIILLAYPYRNGPGGRIIDTTRPENFSCESLVTLSLAICHHNPAVL
jgi:hypothetical protein